MNVVQIGGVKVEFENSHKFRVSVNGKELENVVDAHFTGLDTADTSPLKLYLTIVDSPKGKK